MNIFKIYSCLFLIHFGVFINKQIEAQNVNLIGNWSFELGQNGATPKCWAYYSGQNPKPCEFDNQILYWRIAKKSPNCWCSMSWLGEFCPSPDWYDITYCTDWNPPNPPSNRFVRFGKNKGIRISIPHSFIPNHVYTLRLKLAPFSVAYKYYNSVRQSICFVV